MAERLKVFHLKSAGDSSLKLPEGYWHLATCLRSIILSDRCDHPEVLNQHDYMQGEQAYEFLLKIICGLDSPLLGETEILGQFKDFAKKNEKSFSGPIRDMVNSLLRDAKKIRSEYLQNLGCTSYGSLLRKELKDVSIPLTVVGAGSLAQDILPWFAKSQAVVQVVTRRPQKYIEIVQQKNVKLSSFEEIASLKKEGVLVIAAPVTSQWIADNFPLSHYQYVYDLRADSHQDSLVGDQVTHLQSLFSNIERNKRQAVRTKELAIAAIKKQVHHLSLIERPRPFGWEDLWMCS